MADINSVVGFFCGVVAYTNDEVGIFHCQIESPDLSDDLTLTWSVDGVESKVTTGDIYADTTWRAAFASMVSGGGTLTWTNAADSGRTIRDAVMHLSFLFTTDDGIIHSASITYENGEKINHVVLLAELPSNIDAFITLIEDTLKEIVTAASIA